MERAYSKAKGDPIENIAGPIENKWELHGSNEVNESKVLTQ